MDGVPQKLRLKEHFMIVKEMIVFSLRSFPFLIIAIFIFNTMISLIPAASIWVGKLIIDAIVLMVSNHNTVGMNHLILLIAIEFSILLSQGILNKVVSYINSKYTSLFEIKMKQRLLSKCEKTPYYKFEEPAFYNRFELIMNNVASGSSSYLTQQINLFQSVIKLISISYILVRIDILFLLATVGLNLVNFVIGIQLSKKSFAVEYNLSEPQRISDYIFKLLTEIRSLKDIKLYNLSHYFRKRHKEKSYYITKKRLDFFRKELTLFTVFEFFSTLTFYAFYVYIVFGVIKRRLTVGDISLYQRSYSTFDGALGGLVANFSGVYQQNLYMKLFFDFMKANEETDDINCLQLDTINSIELKNMSFSYPSNPNNLILNDINLQFNKGETILIVGRNGCGKTTLAKLLSQLYKPVEGDILINQAFSHQYSLQTDSQQTRCYASRF